jgi:O-antigen/teichoic acid export membrane protein
MPGAARQGGELEAGGLPLAALVTFGVRIAAAGLAYALQIVLARALGPHEFGLFAIAWITVTVGGFLGSGGLSHAAVRFIPAYRAEGRAADEAGFVRFALRACLIIGIAAGLAAAGLAVALQRLGAIEGPLAAAILAGAVAIPAFALQDLLEGFARARGWSLCAFVPSYILRTLLLIMLVALFTASGSPATATTAMLAGLAATLCAAVVHAALVLPRLLRPREKPIDDDRAAWIAAARPLFLVDGAILARSHVDVVALALFVDAATLGVYVAATRLASLLGLVEYAVSAAMGPRFSAAAARGDRAALEAGLQQSVMICLWISAAGALCLSAAAPLLLALFGSGFSDAAAIVPILAAAAVIRALAGSSEELLAMLGHARAVLAAHAAAAAAGLLAVAALAGPFGAMGAALAAALAAGVNAAVLIGHVMARLGVTPDPFAFGRLKMLLR